MRRRWLPPALAFLLGLLAHVESLGHWFTASDTLPLIETSRIASPQDLWIILTKPMLYGTSFVGGGLFYRPVTNLTYAVDYWVWGLNPFGYHLSNLLFHGLAAVAVTLAIRSMTRSDRVGGLAGALFAVHPLSTDVVPAIARRHDLLMALFGTLALYLFVESLRRSDRRWWYATAVAYGLALLSKEMALVVGPLLFLWALSREPSLTDPDAYVRSFRAVVPMAAVAVAYLAVRVAVLGGIGGYTGSSPFSKTRLIPFEYALALAYPAHALGALRGVSLPLLLALGIAIPAAFLALIGRSARREDLGLVGGGLAALAVAGFAAVTALAAYPSLLADVQVQHVSYVGWYAVGLAFVAATTCALAAARLLVGERTADARRLDLFFVAWLVLPVPLFFVGGQFAFWSAYFFVVPFVTLLSLYLVEMADALPLGDARSVAAAIERTPDRNRTALALVALLLLVPSVAASPLLYTDSGWGAVGETSKQTLTSIDERVAAADGNTHVLVNGVATSIKHNPKKLGQGRELMVLQPYTVRSWMRLQGQENPVTMGKLWFFYTPPKSVSTDTSTTDDGTLVIQIKYQW